MCFFGGYSEDGYNQVSKVDSKAAISYGDIVLKSKKSKNSHIVERIVGIDVYKGN